jgi:hypothetical protein
VTSPEPSADPIWANRSLKDVVPLELLLELLEVLSVLLDVLVELLVVSSRLVSESYADCALVVSPELMALKRASTSLPRALMVEPLELSLLVADELDVELVEDVLGVA